MCLHVRCACWHCDTARCNKTTGVSHRQLAAWTAPLRVICPSSWTSPVFATRKKHECMCLCKRERAVRIILLVVYGNQFWQLPSSSHWTELTTIHCFLKLEWTAFFCSGATNVTTHTLNRCPRKRFYQRWGSSSHTGCALTTTLIHVRGLFTF